MVPLGYLEENNDRVKARDDFERDYDGTQVVEHTLLRSTMKPEKELLMHQAMATLAFLENNKFKKAAKKLKEKLKEDFGDKLPDPEELYAGITTCRGNFGSRYIYGFTRYL